MADETVTFTTPGGTQVTCPKELAERLGYKPEPKRTPAKKAATRKPTE